MHEFILAAKIVGIAAEKSAQAGLVGSPFIELFIDDGLVQADTTNPLFPFVRRPEQKKVARPTPTPQG